jgi:hypothetical protein
MIQSVSMVLLGTGRIHSHMDPLNVRQEVSGEDTKEEQRGELWVFGLKLTL